MYPLTLRHSIPHLFVIIFGIGTDLEENTKKPLADVFAKKVFFKISQSSRQSACVGAFVSKVASSNTNEVIRSVLNFLFFLQ